MDKCKICSNQFKRKYSRGGKRQIYCSKKCKYADQYEKKLCLTCGNEYKRNKLSRKSDKFCSLACIQRSPCQLCGNIITGRVTFQGKEKRFCSKKCSNFFHRTLSSRKSYVPKGFAESLRKHGKIICNRCKNDDVRCLVVHHIDFDRYNNSSHNLETLCANCHFILHFGDSEKRKKTISIAKLIHKYS